MSAGPPSHVALLCGRALGGAGWRAPSPGGGLPNYPADGAPPFDASCSPHCSHLQHNPLHPSPPPGPPGPPSLVSEPPPSPVGGGRRARAALPVSQLVSHFTYRRSPLLTLQQGNHPPVTSCHPPVIPRHLPSPPGPPSHRVTPGPGTGSTGPNVVKLSDW